MRPVLKSHVSQPPIHPVTSADGNAQIHPTCPKVAVSRSPISRRHVMSRHVTSDSNEPKFVNHLMAMLSFIRRVLKSPAVGFPFQVTSRRIPTGQNLSGHLMAMLSFIQCVLKSPHLMAMLSFIRRVLKSPAVGFPFQVTSRRIPTGQNLSGHLMAMLSFIQCVLKSPHLMAMLSFIQCVLKSPSVGPPFSPSRHVGWDSDEPKFVSHPMAMLSFNGQVLKSPVSWLPPPPFLAVQRDGSPS